MIIAHKMLRTALSSRPLLRYLDSTQAEGQPATQAVPPASLSKEAQRALWANHFIKTIICQNFQTTLESPSLRDKLIDSPNPTPEYKFDQAIKNEMTGIFKKGVILNSNVFDQDRIVNARVNNNTIAFYPSVLVTKQVFALLNISSSRFMFQGSYGIGKTISIAFYIYLSNIINSFALLAAKSGNTTFMEEYRSLVSKEYLPSLACKYWYWSIDWDVVKLKGFSLQRILAEQATELTQEEREEVKECKTIEEAQEKIHAFYKKANFTHIAVLDQINHAVSFIRKWNLFVETNKDLIEKANKNKLIEQEDLARIKQAYQPTTQLISLAKKFTAINPFQYILNSSINIERQLLETTAIQDEKMQSEEEKNKQKRLYEPLTFELKARNKRHQAMRVFSFRFQQLVQTQSGKIRFWQFFWEVLEEKTKGQGLSEEELKQIKAAFLKYACSLPLKAYYRFLHIRQFLSDYKFQKRDILKGRDMDEAIKKIISNFESNSLREFKDGIQKFMAKGNSALKRRLLRAIHIYASEQKGNNANVLVLDLQLICYMMGRKDIKQYLVSSEHNKWLISVEPILDKPQIIEIQWSPQDFIDISQEFIFPKQLTNAVLLPDHQIIGIITNPIYRGTIVEILMNILLEPGATITFYTVFGKRKLKQNGQYDKSSKNRKFKQQEILIEGKNSFITFDTNSTESNSKSFEEHFQSVLKECADKPERWIISFPGKDDTKKKDSGNNPSVDFALAQCNINQDNEKKYIVYTFDATFAFTSVRQKENKSKALFLQKAAKFTKKVEVRHHILCMDKHCCPVLPVNQYAKIYYSSIMKMVIQEVPERSTARKVFEEVIKLIIRLYERLYVKR